MNIIFIFCFIALFSYFHYKISKFKEELKEINNYHKKIKIQIDKFNIYELFLFLDFWFIENDKFSFEFKKDSLIKEELDIILYPIYYENIKDYFDDHADLYSDDCSFSYIDLLNIYYFDPIQTKQFKVSFFKENDIIKFSFNKKVYTLCNVDEINDNAANNFISILNGKTNQ